MHHRGEMQNRTGKSSFSKMRNILCNKNISMEIIKKVLTTYVTTILYYGSEVWTMNRRITKQLKATETWFWRRILKKMPWTDKITNKDILKPDLLQEVKSRQMKYFRHLKRHDSLPKTILEGRVEGKRARGRQRYIWENNIKRWTRNSLSECTNGTKDRQRWRSIVANLRIRDGT
jgi:hypothetical protein